MVTSSFHKHLLSWFDFYIPAFLHHLWHIRQNIHQRPTCANRAAVLLWRTFSCLKCAQEQFQQVLGLINMSRYWSNHFILKLNTMSTSWTLNSTHHETHHEHVRIMNTSWTRNLFIDSVSTVGRGHKWNLSVLFQRQCMQGRGNYFPAGGAHHNRD